MFYSNLRKSEIDNYHRICNEYIQIWQLFSKNTQKLLVLRKDICNNLKELSKEMYKIDNIPDDIIDRIKKIELELDKFESSFENAINASYTIGNDLKIDNFEDDKNVDIVYSTVAVLPSIIMAVGTPAAVSTFVSMFGAASTGVAISTLSGAASTSATLAAIGGGSIAAGGGGIALGVTTLMLVGGVAGVVTFGTIGASTYTFINKRAINKYKQEGEKLETNIHQLEKYNEEVVQLLDDISLQSKVVYTLTINGTSLDYEIFSVEEKSNFSTLIDETLKLAKLLNLEINMDNEE